MPDQKLENLLNLALAVPEEERKKSLDPVSYTHLDVYKRQMPGSARDILTGCLWKVLRSTRK